MAATVKRSKGAKGFSSKKMTYNRREARRFLALPPFPYRAKKAAAFLL